MNNNAGFSKGAFGGYTRLDKIDLRPYRKSDQAPEGLLYLHTILDAANNYLFFGLCERNGTTASEFYYAYEYFFNVRSKDQARYEECKAYTKQYYEDGIKIDQVCMLSMQEYDMMCFDTHFKFSRLRCSMDLFLNKLKEQRRTILKANWQQVTTYLDTFINKDDQLNLVFPDRFNILVEPKSPEEVDSLFS